MKLCSVKKCDRQSRARGWCLFHYSRWRDTGSHLTPKRRADNGEPVRWIRRHTAVSNDKCLIWPFSRLKAGYPGAVWIDYKTQILACRFMCALVNGPPPSKKHDAAHSCGRGRSGCINPSHLRWATKQQNVDDRRLHGANTVGVDHPMAKLNDSLIREILASKATCQYLADQFSVSKSLISMIRLRKIWRHVT